MAEFTPDQLRSPENAVQQTQIIGGALAFGMIALVVVAVVVVTAVQPGGISPNPTLEIVFGIAIAVLAAGTTLAGFAVPGPVAAAARRNALKAPTVEQAEKQIAAGYAGLIIIRSALAEGWGLFGGVALIITGQWQFVIAPALSCALLGTFFPTRTRFSAFFQKVVEKTDG